MAAKNQAVIQLSEWFAPPNCKPSWDNKEWEYKEHDIGIMELQSEVKFSDGKSSAAIGPICLPEPNEVRINQFLNFSI